MLVSYNQLSEMTGKTYRTIKRRMNGLEPVGVVGRANGFDSAAALELIYQHSEKTGELGLTEERARLAKEQADRYEIKNAVAREKLLPADEVMAAWVRLITAAKIQMMAIPSEVAPILLEILERPDAVEIVERIDTIIKRVLFDLSNLKLNKKKGKK